MGVGLGARPAIVQAHASKMVQCKSTAPYGLLQPACQRRFAFACGNAGSGSRWWAEAHPTRSSSPWKNLRSQAALPLPAKQGRVGFSPPTQAYNLHANAGSLSHAATREVVRDGGLKPTLPDRRHLERICVRKLPFPFPFRPSPQPEPPATKGGSGSERGLPQLRRCPRRAAVVGRAGTSPARPQRYAAMARMSPATSVIGMILNFSTST